MFSWQTCGDAEVRLVWGDVMDAVVLAGKDDVAILQEHDPTGETEVRVRPLVNLVSERHKDGQCIQVAVQGVDMVNLRWNEKKTETRWDRGWICFSQIRLDQKQAGFVDTKLTGGEGEKVEGHVCERDYGQHAVVTIGFNEVVTGDGCGVDVVLSKWSYKGLRDRSDSREQGEIQKNASFQNTDYLE